MKLKDIFDLPDLNIPGLKASSKFAPATKLGDILTKAFEIVLLISAFLAFYWFVWGAFHYIFAGGNKEQLAKARSRMIWAVVGLILILLGFAVVQFAIQILQPQRGTPFTLIPITYAAATVTTSPASGVDIGKAYPFGDIQNLGQGTNRLVLPAFSIAMVAVVIYFLIGAFKILVSGGDKSQLESARAMITHAIIGFILLIFAFFVLPFVLSRLFGITTFQIIPIP